MHLLLFICTFPSVTEKDQLERKKCHQDKHQQWQTQFELPATLHFLNNQMFFLCAVSGNMENCFSGTQNTSLLNQKLV